jgi:hypothetical protein
MNPEGPAHGEVGGRIDLFQLDRLMQGLLSEAEASALMAQVEALPEAKAYLARYSGARSRLKLSDIRRPARKAWHPRLPTLENLLRGNGGRAFAFAAVVLFLGIGLSIFPPRRIITETGLHSKGQERTDVRLMVAGNEMEAGSLAEARNGDTLALSYRTSDSLHVQVWFQEEKSGPKPMGGGQDGFVWSPTTSWAVAPEKIVLEGEWKRQSVWVILSPEPFMPGQAEAAMQGKVSGKVRASQFRIVNSR